ncbi:MAG: porin [Gammaproteobacteria bacterium]|nr:porin [Gammaproteobacteria bacterium]
MKRLKWLSVALVPSLPLTALAAPTTEELQRQLQQQQERIDVLAAQLEKTADKAPSKTHVGGYGEMHYNNLKDETAGAEKKEVDFHRFVVYVAHDFTDKVRFFSELEVEHAWAGDNDKKDKFDNNGKKPGEVELEQAYIEFDLPNNAKAKGGLFLVPVGILNETHEPPTFYGVERNPVEHNILLSTWWEGGAAIGGAIGDTGLGYDFAVHSGLKVGSDFKVRDGRQKVAEASAEDLAYTVRLKYTGLPGVELASSYQRQEDVTQTIVGDAASAQLIEAHAVAQAGPFSARALWARWDIDGAAAKAAKRDEQDGFYAEAAYRVVPAFGFFSRYAVWDNGGSPGAGFTETEIRQVNTGFNYWPVENVVVKADVQTQSGGDDDDGFNLGIGYSF